MITLHHQYHIIIVIDQSYERLGYSHRKERVWLWLSPSHHFLDDSLYINNVFSSVCRGFMNSHMRVQFMSHLVCLPFTNLT
jgi:hypothetical protein